MKAFLAVILSAAVVSAVPTGWGAPSVPNVALDLAASVATTGSGAAGGEQVMSEELHGNSDVPASITSVNGVSAGLSNGGDVVQVANADMSGASPVTSTLQAVSAYNQGYASDILAAEAVAADSIAIANAASTYGEGTGTIDSSASSSNVVNTKKY